MSAPVFLSQHAKSLPKIEHLLSLGAGRPDKLLNEHEVYEVLEAAGMELPDRYFHPISKHVSSLASALDSGKKYVAKATITGCTHKTDIGAVTFNVTAENAAETVDMFAKKFNDMQLEGVLFAEQLGFDKGGLGGGEWLLSAYEDPFFGPTLAFGVGGTGVEYAKDVFSKSRPAQVFIPAALDIDVDSVIRDALDKLPASEMLTGKVRGMKRRVDDGAIANSLKAMQNIVRHYSVNNPDARYVVREIEVNPAVTCDGKLLALDGVMRVEENPNFNISEDKLAMSSDFKTRKPVKQIEALLRPKSAAVIGASSKNPNNSCSVILRKLADAPNSSVDTKQLYPIHPKSKDIQGFPCASSISDLLAKHTIEQNAAKAVLAISGGFAETEKGAALQHEVEKKLAEADAAGRPRPVINGPNTLGCIYDGIGVNTVFTPSEKSSKTGRGSSNSAIICQSGAFMISRLGDMANIVNPRVSVSVGNQLDMSVCDFLEYFLHHDTAPETKEIDAFGLYIEGLKEEEGVRLMKLIKDARSMGKSVVIYKAGRSKQGQEAAKGHTAAMAGDYGMFSDKMVQAGAIVVDTAREFENTMMLLGLWGPKIKTLSKKMQKEGI
ncbi:conserved hypothetical protein, partial [Aduncisulcus paluster]